MAAGLRNDADDAAASYLCSSALAAAAPVRGHLPPTNFACSYSARDRFVPNSAPAIEACSTHRSPAQRARLMLPREGAERSRYDDDACCESQFAVSA